MRFTPVRVLVAGALLAHFLVLGIELNFGDAQSKLRVVLEQPEDSLEADVSLRSAPGRVDIPAGETVTVLLTKDGPKPLKPCPVEGKLLEYGEIFERDGYFYTCFNVTGNAINDHSFSRATHELVDSLLARFHRVHGNLTTRFSKEVFVRSPAFRRLVKTVVGTLKNATNTTQGSGGGAERPEETFEALSARFAPLAERANRTDFHRAFFQASAFAGATGRALEARLADLSAEFEVPAELQEQIRAALPFLQTYSRRVSDVSALKLYGYFKNRALADERMALNETLAQELETKADWEAGTPEGALPTELAAEVSAFIAKHGTDFEILPREVLLKTHAFLELQLASRALFPNSEDKKISASFLYAHIANRLKEMKMEAAAAAAKSA